MIITLKGLSRFRFTTAVAQHVQFLTVDIMPLLRRWTVISKQRRDLAALPDHLLKDIGVNRETALQETRKSFWEV